jgi:uncharacterized damage-inducible protein DinB
MKLDSKDIQRVIEMLKQAPLRIKKATNNVQSKQLHVRTADEPWSINDILIHLRACSDVWGDTITNMLREDNPSQRYQSPRAFMKKPKYQNQEFPAGLDSYTQERQKLIKVLMGLDQAGWSRPGTYTGVTARHQHQTVWSLVNRILDHEQPHLDQIETLLK